MALELIKISEFPESVDTKDWFVVGDVNGVAYKISRANLESELGIGALMQFGGAIVPTSTPEATGDYFWIATEEGTYTNFGGVVVPAASMAVISRIDGVFTSSITTIPQPENRIDVWEAGTYAQGDQRIHNGKIWSVDVLSTTEEPGTGADWMEATYSESDRYIQPRVPSDVATHIFADSADSVVAYIAKDGDFVTAQFPEGLKGRIDMVSSDIDGVKGILSKASIKDSLYVFVDNDKNIVAVIDKGGNLHLAGLPLSVQDEVNELRKYGKSYLPNSKVEAGVFSSLTPKGNELLVKRAANGLSNFAVPFGVMPQNWDLDHDLVKLLSAPKSQNHIQIGMMNGNIFNPDSGVVHPNVTSFGFPVNGCRYWMTLNGYPDETWEITWLYGTNNDDLTGWELISSLPQPFDGNPPLEPPYVSSHDSDSFMTYNPLTGEMVVVWRRSMRTVDTETTEYLYRASNNGIDWSEPKVLYHPTLSTDDLLLSAGIVFNPNDNLFYMFYVHPEKIRYRTNKDLYNPDGWSAHTIIEAPNGIKPWHLEVKFVGKSVMLLIHENQNRSPGNDKLWFAMSTDLITWTWSDADLLGGTTPLYKSSFLPIPNVDGTIKFKVIYTTDETAPEGEQWKLHVTETENINI